MKPAEREPKAWIAGVGPGSPEYITERVRNAIREAEIVVGWRVSLNLVSSLLDSKTVMIEDVDNYPQVVMRAADICREEGKPTVVLTTGDACVSAALEEMLGAFKGVDVEVIPGVSSVQMAAGRAGVTLEESVIVSFHKLGSVTSRLRWVTETLSKGRNVICLLDEDFPASWVAEQLLRRKVRSVRDVVVCQSLSLPEEKVFRGTLSEVRSLKTIPLSVAVLRARTR
jgi:iron complex transport system substrate-binding protein